MTTTQTQTSTAILARDLSDSTADVLRTTWTRGKMDYLVWALAGQPVMVILDSQTGHAAIGVTLTRTRDGFSGQAQVGVRFADGSVTYFALSNLGETIVPLDESPIRGAKWDLLDGFRQAKSAAIAKVATEHGEVEGRAWGKWTATPVRMGVWSCVYEPAIGNPAFADQWGERGHWVVEV